MNPDNATQKDIKDYAHLYLGCQVRIYNDVLKGFGNWRKMSPTDLALIVTHNKAAELSLRPLSDMTEKEAIELVKLSEWKQYGDHPHKREYRAYRNGFNEIVVSWGESIREKNVPVTKEVFGFDEFQYLLSKHFDLFGLIESGLAIDKTKTT